MKKISVLLLLCSFGHLYAQETPPKKDHPSTSSQRRNVTDLGDALILNLTSDNWLHQTAGMKTKPLRSRGFSFMIMTEKSNQSATAGFAFGLGLSSQNVHSNSFPRDSAGTAYTNMQVFPSGMDYDLNKLSLNFLDAGFEIRLATHENKHEGRFKLNAGMKGGWLFQSHTKFENGNGKTKTYHVDNLNRFQYGMTGRIAYKHWGVCGYYSLLPVFKHDKGPDLVPYSIGISFTQ